MAELIDFFGDGFALAARDLRKQRRLKQQQQHFGGGHGGHGQLPSGRVTGSSDRLSDDASQLQSGSSQSNVSASLAASSPSIRGMPTGNVGAGSTFGWNVSRPSENILVGPISEYPSAGTAQNPHEKVLRHAIHHSSMVTPGTADQHHLGHHTIQFHHHHQPQLQSGQTTSGLSSGHMISTNSSGSNPNNLPAAESATGSTALRSSLSKLSFPFSLFSFPPTRKQ